MSGTEAAESYCGFADFILDQHPTFADEIKALLPEGAEFRKEVNDFEDDENPYWVVSLGDNEMQVLYDDECLIRYIHGTVWGDTVVSVLDFMDRVGVATFGEPCRFS